MNEPTCGRCDHQLEFCTCISRLAYDAWQAKRAVEQKAWAILAIAMRNLATTEAWLNDPADADEEAGIVRRFRVKEEREAVASARQALRDLGVDVDALLTEEP